jgi:hypothetical protein
MKRPVRILMWVVVSAAIVVVLLYGVVIVSMAYSGGIAWPLLYELPPGYGGWIQVFYEQPHCPPMGSRGPFYVIQVSQSGRGCTSDTLPEGWKYHRAVSLNPDGSRTKRPLHLISYSSKSKDSLIFIGTGEELARSWEKAPR